MIKNFCIVFLLTLGFSSLALSAEDKNVTFDQAIGGMEQGRRISAPGSNSNNIASEKHGSAVNPVTDAHAHPFVQTTGNRGYMNFNATGSDNAKNAINRNGSQQTNGTLNASNALTGTNPSQAGNSAAGQNNTEHGAEAVNSNTGAVQASTGQTNGSVN